MRQQGEQLVWSIRWLSLLLVSFAAWTGLINCSTAPRNTQTTESPASAVDIIEPPNDESCNVAKGYPGRSVDIASLPQRRIGFFPKSPADFRDRNFDPVQNEWYGKFLRALNQRSLLIGTNDQEDFEIYRFIWLRTFDHPIIVQVSRRGRSFQVNSVENDGAGGYEPGNLLRTDQNSFDKEAWCHLVQLLNDANFWSMPSIEDNPGGNDGSQWILEGVRGARYHVVDRWTPSVGQYRQACLYLLMLSGRDIEKMGGDLY